MLVVIGSFYDFICNFVSHTRVLGFLPQNEGYSTLVSSNLIISNSGLSALMASYRREEKGREGKEGNERKGG